MEYLQRILHVFISKCLGCTKMVQPSLLAVAASEPARAVLRIGADEIPPRVAGTSLGMGMPEGSRLSETRGVVEMGNYPMRTTL
jgi:hypothetical protein